MTVLIVCFALIIPTISQSQSCLPDGITFTTQSQIDSFQINYPGCSEIEGFVIIGNGSTDITNLDGLNVLTSIGGGLWIWDNFFLESLTGLDYVTNIGGTLDIKANQNLTSLSALGNLTSIGGKLRIIYNDALTSLSGLDNIDPGTIDDLVILSNYSLSSCETQCICDYLASPNGSVDIAGNEIGCKNPGEIASACGFTLPCLPYGNYYFHSQLEVDEFQSIYPGCTDLEGFVLIHGADIENLNGLNAVSSIGKELRIENNDSLGNLSGLDNLTSIGGEFRIVGNDALVSLVALNNVSSIEGYLMIAQNNSLTSLDGLDNVTSIGNSLKIFYNEVLNSLEGVNNINPGSVSFLEIYFNPSLSSCEVETVCAILANQNVEIDIYENTVGCNSPEEVLDSCEANSVHINEQVLEDVVILYPNPATSEITITGIEGIIEEIIIYNKLGQKVILERKPPKTIDVSSLSRGLYIVEVRWDGHRVREKFIVQ